MERPRNYENPEAIRPITPEEITEMQLDAMPDTVLEIVNRLITEKIRQGNAVIYQKDIVRELVGCGFKSEEIFARGWLNFEDIYRASGWKVEYDKPGWNETYDAYFKFSIPGHRKVGYQATRQYGREQS